MKHKVIALRLQPPTVTVGVLQQTMSLPEGCKGILLVFESKASARKWFGKDIPLQRVELDE